MARMQVQDMELKVILNYKRMMTVGLFIPFAGSKLEREL